MHYQINLLRDSVNLNNYCKFVSDSDIDIWMLIYDHFDYNPPFPRDKMAGKPCQVCLTYYFVEVWSCLYIHAYVLTVYREHKDVLNFRLHHTQIAAFYVINQYIHLLHSLWCSTKHVNKQLEDNIRSFVIGFHDFFSSVFVAVAFEIFKRYQIYLSW